MESTIQMIEKKVIPFQITDWNNRPVCIHQGESGYATWKTVKTGGGLRIRVVEYSAGYKANHWCSLGHVTYYLNGEFISELSDGRHFRLSAGMSHHVSDGVSSHRSSSVSGAMLLIVDGDFLSVDKNPPINPWRM